MVSVVVPVYNVEKYLHRCVDSILAQSYRDFEIILVDDGSQDNSGLICDDYSTKDSRIFVIHQQNAGVAAARNNGVGKAKGKYITFVDSDDWIHPSYLEKLYTLVETNDAEIAITCEIVMENDKKVHAYSTKPRILSGQEAVICYGLENRTRITTPWGKLVRADIIKSVPFPEGRSYGEDTACVYKWYWKANRVVDIGERLYYYYLSENSLGRGVYSRSRLGVFDTYKEMIAFFNCNQLMNLTQKYATIFIRNAIIDYQTLAYYEEINDDGIRLNLKRIIEYGERKYYNCLDYFYDYDSLVEYTKDIKDTNGNRAVDELLQHLVWQIEETKRVHRDQIARKERRRLRSLLIKYHKVWPIRKYMHAYQIAFPRTISMAYKLYSTLKL